MNRDRGRRVSLSFDLDGNQEAKYWLNQMSKENARHVSSKASTTASVAAAPVTAGPNATSRSLWNSKKCVAKALPTGVPTVVRSTVAPGASAVLWKHAQKNLKFK
eukprot:m.421770 g.421770  ORF g.421770 m.421770 type:complete len:105 (+) comp34871_c0_seq1:60-374(+)